MASRAETRVVNLAGLVQGITLVTFPAASSVFTDPTEYDLSSTQYGTMFLPQVLTAITTSLLGAGLAQRISSKRVLLLGLAANITSMVMLVMTTAVETDHSVAYPLLLVATAFLGAGFGLTVPVLNTFVAAFRPDSADRAVLVLNALLGLGTALAPVFVAIFVGLGFWWGLPVLSTVLLTLLLLASTRLPLHAETRDVGDRSATRAHIPPRFWLFAGFAVLYGICETMNGNWSQQDMTSDLGASRTQASLALTAFWAMVTVGRILFAAIVRWMPARIVFHGVADRARRHLHPDSGSSGRHPVAWCRRVRPGRSGLLRTPSADDQPRPARPGHHVGSGRRRCDRVLSGPYGIAAFGVGPLVDRGVSLSSLYGWTAVAAGAMALLSFAVAARQASPPELHPRPAGHEQPADSGG